MAFSLDDVRHIAMLARLGLSHERALALVTELNSILEHMHAISRVDTEGVAEAVGVGAAGLPLRPDHGPPIPLEASPESFAPKMRSGFFLVPRLSTHEEADRA